MAVIMLVDTITRHDLCILYGVGWFKVMNRHSYFSLLICPYGPALELGPLSVHALWRFAKEMCSPDDWTMLVFLCSSVAPVFRFCNTLTI
jgi:hypothetical protein